MPLPPVSPLAGPLKTLSNTNPIPEHKWKIRNMRNKKKRSSLQKRHLKKTLRHKTFEEPMNIFFHATVDGVTVIKSAECFETMEEFAYIMFSHNFCDKGRVNLSISVSGLDGIPKSVYNLADVKYLRCFVNAHGRTEPRSQKCHVIAAHFCNDPNGNPDLLSEQWIRFRFFASVGRFPALNTWMACLSRYIHPPSPLARPYLAQQDEQKEEPPVNLDILAEKPRKWKKETSFLVKFLRIQILNKQLEKPVILRFHVTVGAPNAEERCYLTKKVITMRRITEYVHIDFENEIDLPVEVMIVCQSFDRGDTLLLSAKNIRYWEGYCDIHGRNKKVRKVQLYSSRRKQKILLLSSTGSQLALLYPLCLVYKLFYLNMSTEDDPPSYFEAYFFNKYLPQLGLFSRPADERYRVVKKKNKNDKTEFVFPPASDKPWNESLVPPAYDEVRQCPQPLRSLPDPLHQRQIAFEVMVGLCSFQIVEDILIGAVHRLEFELCNDLNVMVRLRVHLGSSCTNRLMYEAIVEDRASGVIIGFGKNSGCYKITMELFRDKEEQIVFRKVEQEMGRN